MFDTGPWRRAESTTQRATQYQTNSPRTRREPCSWRTVRTAVRQLARAASLGALCVCSSSAQNPCAVDQVIVNTGYDHLTSSTLPISSIDPRWTIVSDPQSSTQEPRPATVIDKHSAWQPVIAGSQWISGYPTSAQPDNGAYIFETVFCLLPGIDLNAATITIGMRADDACYAYVNKSLADVLPGSGVTPFHSGQAFNAGVVTYGTYSLAGIGATAGTNVLRIRVQNTGSVAMGLDAVATINASPAGTAEKPECCSNYGALQGLKYNDLNGNGVRDSGEPVLPGWQINLSGPGGLNLSAVTDNFGYFNFPGLPPDTYTLSETQHGGWVQTQPASGTYVVTLTGIQGMAGLDFGNRVAGPCDVSQVILTSGYNHLSAGTLPIGAIDPRWLVVQDPFGSTTEPRPATVIAKHPAWFVPDAGSQWISGYPTSIQSQNGDYYFETKFCLSPEVDLALTNLQLGMRADDGCSAFLNGSTVPFHIGQAFNAALLTFGSYPLSSIGGVKGQNILRIRVQNTGGTAMGLNLVASVFATPTSTALRPDCCSNVGVLQGLKYNDLNANGVRDANEPGLAGWQINLLGSNGIPQSCTTDAGGYYNFTELPADTYTLTETQQAGWTQSAPPLGSHVVTLSGIEGIGGLDFGNHVSYCTGGGGGGPIPPIGSGDGTFPAVLPSSPLALSLSVVVPPGSVLKEVRLNGVSHTWAGDTQWVLTSPAGPVGTSYNVLCGMPADPPADLAGDYGIVGPAPTCSGVAFPWGTSPIPSGTYSQSFGGYPSGTNGILNVPLEQIPVASGVWTLTVYDWVNGDSGALTDWELCFGSATPSASGPAYQCVGTGSPGMYPIGGVAGVWPTTMPAGQLSSPLSVVVPNGSTKIMAVKIYGWNHTWYDDTQIVLEAPASLGGQLYNVLQANNGVAFGTCGDDLGGDYVFVDAVLGLDACGNPAGAPPACSGSIPAGTYLQSYGTWPNGSSAILNTDLQSIAPIGNGVWTLHFYDWFPGGDDGSITSWELCFDQGVPQPYCTGGTTTNGCVANISATANPSLLAAAPCQIAVSNVEGNKTGIIFYGLAVSAIPWAPGSTSYLCVKSPTQRSGTQNSGGTMNACDGSFALDWDAFQASNPLALGQPWSVGNKAYLQAWFRDPPAPKTTNLSNALELTYQP